MSTCECGLGLLWLRVNTSPVYDDSAEGSICVTVALY